MAVGVIGYVLIERWSFMDALYMTVLTVTTIGFFEVHPMDTAGRVFTMILAVGGVGGGLYALANVAAFIVEGNLGTSIGRGRMKNHVEHLKDHFILCGFGRVGEEIARRFKEERVHFVVVENHPSAIARLIQSGHFYVEGDATRDSVLKDAGIERAKGLVAAVGSDTDNTYITLTARGLRSDIFIEARATEEEAESKLKRAGADRVVKPYDIGGARMALLATRPALVDFIDTATIGRNGEYRLETLTVPVDSPAVGLSLKKALCNSGVTTLGIVRHDSALLPNPSENETVYGDDKLIVFGSKSQLAVLEQGICLYDQGELKE
jgi:voltage-gated potassium channel